MAEKKVPFTVDWGKNLVKTEAWTDEDRVFVESKQDVTEILADNRRQRNAHAVKFNSRFDGTGRWHKAAVIPNIMVDRWMRDGSWWDKRFIKKLLNDPDYKYLRTSVGWI